LFIELWSPGDVADHVTCQSDDTAHFNIEMYTLCILCTMCACAYVHRQCVVGCWCPYKHHV